MLINFSLCNFVCLSMSLSVCLYVCLSLSLSLGIRRVARGGGQAGMSPPVRSKKIFFSAYNDNVDVIQAIFDTNDLAPELK